MSVGVSWSGDKKPWGQDNIGYFILRLKTGETLLTKMNGSIDNFTFNPTITLIDPVLITFQQPALLPPGWKVTIDPTLFVMQPLLSLSIDEEITLASDVIMSVGTMKFSARIKYTEYVSQMHARNEIEERAEALEDFLTSIGVTLVVDIS